MAKRVFPSLPALLIPISYCVFVISAAPLYKITALSLGFMLSSCNFCLCFQLCPYCKSLSILAIVNLPNGSLSIAEFFWPKSTLYCRLFCWWWCSCLSLTACRPRLVRYCQLKAPSTSGILKAGAGSRVTCAWRTVTFQSIKNEG